MKVLSPHFPQWTSRQGRWQLFPATTTKLVLRRKQSEEMLGGLRCQVKSIGLYYCRDTNESAFWCLYVTKQWIITSWNHHSSHTIYKELHSLYLCMWNFSLFSFFPISTFRHFMRIHLNIHVLINDSWNSELFSRLICRLGFFSSSEELSLISF